MASKEIEILDSAATVGKLKKIAAGRAVNRRHFMAALGMTGAAAGAGLLSGCSTTTAAVSTTSTTPAQTDLLNFILNVKLLEATFYAFVTTGSDLTGAAVLNSGAVSGAPAKLTFPTPQITDMMSEIYYDEKNHVNTLISLLGASVVFRPALNLAAFGAITATNVLAIARLLEDVGVTALTGASTALISSDQTLASQILAVEGFHAGAMRLVNIQNPTFATYIKADSLDVPPVDLGTAALSAAGPTASGGIFPTTGGTAAATLNLPNPAGFTITRNPTGILGALAVLYGAPGTPAAVGTTSGGFFPSGVNGNIRSV